MSAADDVPVAVIASPFWVLPTLLVLIILIWWVRMQVKYRIRSPRPRRMDLVMPATLTEQDRDWLIANYDLCGDVVGHVRGCSDQHFHERVTRMTQHAGRCVCGALDRPPPPYENNTHDLWGAYLRVTERIDHPSLTKGYVQERQRNRVAEKMRQSL